MGSSLAEKIKAMECKNSNPEYISGLLDTLIFTKASETTYSDGKMDFIMIDMVLDANGYDSEKMNTKIAFGEYLIHFLNYLKIVDEENEGSGKKNIDEESIYLFVFVDSLRESRNFNTTIKKLWDVSYDSLFQTVNKRFLENKSESEVEEFNSLFGRYPLWMKDKTFGQVIEAQIRDCKRVWRPSFEDLEDFATGIRNSYYSIFEHILSLLVRHMGTIPMDQILSPEFENCRITDEDED